MNAIDQYQQTKQTYRRFEQWKSLIGKEYYGGTCGKGGEYGKVVSATFEYEIYHQESDGARNYHSSKDLSDLVRQSLNEAAKKHAPAIIGAAFEIMLAKLAKDADAANQLADQIIQDQSKI